MERLTERELNSVNNVSYCKCFFKGCNGQCATCDLQYEADMKLKEYEDLEEQGMIIKLPCKVGAKVYHIAFNYKTTKKEKIVETTFSLEMLEDYKKWWFLTKEEAEAKLKELENE